MRKVLAGACALAAVALGLTVAAPPGSGPDPAADALADGCERNPTGLYTSESPNWAYVGDRHAAASGPPPPARWLRGLAHSQYRPWLATHPTEVDNPLTHRSYDFVLNVRPDPGYRLLLGGDSPGKTGNFQGRSETTGRMHIEREAGAYPMWAWPEPGDRIELRGSWVWDCDHFQGGGERTELHPFRAIFVHRGARPGAPSPRSPLGESEGDLFISTEKTPAGTQADCAHRTKGDRAAFRACVSSDDDWQDVSGRYRFFLRAPPKPAPRARLTVRVVDRGSTRGAPLLRVQKTERGVRIALDLAVPRGRRVVIGKQFYVGWTPMPAGRLPVHLRLAFRTLRVRRAMDPSCALSQPRCPARHQSTRLGQISRPPGEWTVYWDVAGIWGLWRPTILRARDGQVFRSKQTVDVYVARRSSWRLFLLARECDFGALGSAGRPRLPVAPCPRSSELGGSVGDDAPGAVVQPFRSPASAVGEHRADSLLEGSSCPPTNRRGCYEVTYGVRVVNDAARRAARPRRP